MTEETTADRCAVGSPVQRHVRPDQERDEWQHLKRYGYAPGGYMNKCHRCGVVVIVDKRAITCLPCAEAMHAAATAPGADTPKWRDGVR